MPKLMRLLSYVGVAVVSALASVAAVSYAAVPDSNGVIHGCYSNLNGSLRIIDSEAGQGCNALQTAISWNQVGVPGPPGPQGPAGPAGSGTDGRYVELPWGRSPSAGHQ